MSNASEPIFTGPVYLSGPMFSVADQWQQAGIATALENVGIQTYLPQRDGIEVGSLMARINQESLPAVEALMQFVLQIVFSMDEFQLLSRCKALVLNMDGRVPDEGSVSETAAAFAAGQPIVIYKTTPISMLGGLDNPMISGLAMNWAKVNDVAAIPNAVISAVQAMGNLGGPTVQFGKQVQAVLALGAAVWDAIDQIHTLLQNPNINTIIAGFQAMQQQWQQLINAAFPGAPPLPLPTP